VALQQQYQELRFCLDPKLITEAKSSARGMIRRKTLAIAAGDLVPIVAPTPRRVSEKPIPPNRVAAKGTFKKNRQRLETFFETMAGVVPKCPKCRMRCGLPKKSWPSREMADECRERSPDPAEVNVYPCPYQPGFWHVGHPQSTRRMKRPPQPIGLGTVPQVEQAAVVDRSFGFAIATSQQPFDGLSVESRDPEERHNANLLLPTFCGGDVALSDADGLSEFRLIGVEASQFPNPPANGLPIHNEQLGRIVD
jgi:hypothetical protein